MILILAYARLLDVKVSGARFFKPSFIKSTFNYRHPVLGVGSYTRYSPGRIRRSAAQLEQIYRDSGFFDVRVKVRDSSVGRDFVIVVEVDEGPRYVIRRISAPFRALKHLKLRLPRPYSETFVSQIELYLMEWYQNGGYPFVEVNREIYVEDTSVDITFNVNTGPKVVIRDIEFKSVDSTSLKTRRKVFQREVVVRENECFSLEKIKRSLDRLYRTLLFVDIRWKLTELRKASEGSCGDTSAVLVFYVKEGKPKVLDLTAGIQSENEKPILLNTEVSFQHTNLFNNLQKFRLSISSLVDIIDQNLNRFSFQALYQEPYFLDRYLRANLNAIGERDQDRAIMRIGLYTEIVKPYNRLELSFGQSAELRYPIGGAEGEDKYRLFKVFERIHFDTRNDIFDPSWGSKVTLYTEEAGLGYIGDYDFLKGTAEISAYQKFFLTEWKWAARMRVGKILSVLRSDTLPFYELFTLGGEGQVRGYDRFSIGKKVENCDLICHAGTSLLLFNYEIRRRIWRNLGGVVFFDFGYLSGDYGYSSGLGIRYFTPIGPVRVDWGVRLKDRSPTDKGKIYIGIGHMF